MKKHAPLLLVIVSFLFNVSAFAVGPKKLAISDRNLWPHSIEGQKSFDMASRFEILSFLQSLIEIKKRYGTNYRDFTGLKRENRASIDKWIAIITKDLTDNFNHALRTCDIKKRDVFCYSSPISQRKLLSIAENFDIKISPKYLSWYTNARQFHKIYLFEQFRLASLFPRISSEIMTFSKKEILGKEFDDMHFLLTFDDGPSKNSRTGKLIEILRQHQKNGIFFVLGERFASNVKKKGIQKTRSFYRGMCVASHGQKHKSHASWKQWKSSILSTKSLIEKIFPNSQNQATFFRPPYGQRRSDSAAFFKQNDIQVMLWNMDSQDWNSKINSEQIASRMFSLMLLWRKGILLFHDVHPKAKRVLPTLFGKTKNTQIHWKDCNDK